MHPIKAWLKFYKCNYQPLFDTETDTSKCNWNIKKIAYYVGCQDNRSDRYRCFNFASALRKENIAVDIYDSKSICFLTKNVQYDAVIMFRENRYGMLHIKKVIKSLHSKKIPVIYDTDDFTIEDKENRYSKNILKIIRLCDAVTVTTAFLAELFVARTGKPVYVIKNTINERQLYVEEKFSIKKSPDENVIKIVYQSGTSTHNADFKQIEESLLFVLEKYENVEFHVFGPLELSWKFIPYSERIFNHPYMDYLKLQCEVSNMDINIAPLVLNDFNNSKSEVKIFEAALLKIPTICSPTEPYKAIIKNGTNGFVAETVEDWKNAFSELIENNAKRRQIGKNAFNDFVAMFSVENEVKNVIKTFERIKCESGSKN